MNGHLPLIDMRSKGLRPKIVFLNDWPCQTNWFETGDHVTISLNNQDTPETLDLRFLKGVAVSVSSHSESRAKRLGEACKRHSCAVVASCHVIPVNKHRSEPGWSEVWRPESEVAA